MDINRTVEKFCRSSSKLDGLDLPDPIAMAIALDPAVATLTEPLSVQIDTSDGVGRGQTIIDFTGLTGRTPNADVVLEASHTALVEALCRDLAP